MARAYHLEQMDLDAEAARLRAEAEAKPLRLPVNRRVTGNHSALTDDGLRIWFTQQRSPHNLIWEALFERRDGVPTDAECGPWIAALFLGEEPEEAAGAPGSHSRRFELFGPLQTVPA